MLYGVVLAGGQSSRMGRDKRWLDYDGRSLLEHARRILSDSGVDRVLLSGQVPGYEGITDRVPDAGPPGALHATVEHIAASDGLNGDGLLVIPVDMPALYPALLSRLSALVPTVAAAHYQGEVFPCVFRLDDALLALLREGTERQRTLQNGRKGFSMRAILGSLRARVLAGDDIDRAAFRNMNTPGDWAAFQRSRPRQDG